MDSGLDLGFWDSQRKQYVAYIRDRPGVRSVKTLGYVPLDATREELRSDLLHTNAVA